MGSGAIVALRGAELVHSTTEFTGTSRYCTVHTNHDNMKRCAEAERLWSTFPYVPPVDLEYNDRKFCRSAPWRIDERDGWNDDFELLRRGTLPSRPDSETTSPSESPPAIETTPFKRKVEETDVDEEDTGAASKRAKDE